MIQVFVYGTLRGTGRKATLAGFSKDDTAQFPTIYPDPGHRVEGEVITVSHVELAQMDHYEGFHPERPERSLYVRMETADGSYVYVANVEQHDAWDVSYEMDEVEEQLAECAVVLE